jgi:hypothetical protein
MRILYAALAVGALVSEGPQAHPSWEYARLVIIPQGHGGAVPVWSAGDSTAVLTWTPQRDVVGSDYTPRTIAATSSYIHVLNQLGAAGWEVVSSQSDGIEQVTLFKRPVS